MDKLVQVRDKVLDRAALKQGERLLDVGAGEGWIGFGAFGRGAGEVVFSDISTDVLDACREAAEELGVADRCEYVDAAADDLSALEDASVDVVTTRSVLIYVAEKQQALREFFRVLRPGGRVSLFEPINRFALRGSWSRASGSWPTRTLRSRSLRGGEFGDVGHAHPSCWRLIPSFQIFVM